MKWFQRIDPDNLILCLVAANIAIHEFFQLAEDLGALPIWVFNNGSELFKEYIMTALATKTVVYVTHQVEFLPAADLIMVIKEGRVIQAGKYDELMQAGTDFDALVSAHHEAIEAMDIPNLAYVIYL